MTDIPPIGRATPYRSDTVLFAPPAPKKQDAFHVSDTRRAGARFDGRLRAEYRVQAIRERIAAMKAKQEAERFAGLAEKQRKASFAESDRLLMELTGGFDGGHENTEGRRAQLGGERAGDADVVDKAGPVPCGGGEAGRVLACEGATDRSPSPAEDAGGVGCGESKEERRRRQWREAKAKRVARIAAIVQPVVVYPPIQPVADCNPLPGARIAEVEARLRSRGMLAGGES